MGFSWFTEIIPKYNWVVESPYTANNHGFGHCSFGIWYGRLRPTFTEYLVERILWNIETSQLCWCFARSQCGCFFVCRWNFCGFCSIFWFDDCYVANQNQLWSNARKQIIRASDHISPVHQNTTYLMTRLVIIYHHTCGHPSTVSRWFQMCYSFSILGSLIR